MVKNENEKACDELAKGVEGSQISVFLLHQSNELQL